MAKKFNQQKKKKKKNPLYFEISFKVNDRDIDPVFNKLMLKTTAKTTTTKKKLLLTLKLRLNSVWDAVCCAG